MMLRRVVLGEVVGVVGSAGVPEEVEVALVDAVPHPIIPHVDGAGAALTSGSSEDTGGGGIIGDYWGGGLGMLHLGEEGSDVCSVLSVGEESSHFGLHHGGQHVFHDAAFDQDGAVG